MKRKRRKLNKRVETSFFLLCIVKCFKLKVLKIIYLFFNHSVKNNEKQKQEQTNKQTMNLIVTYFRNK